MIILKVNQMFARENQEKNREKALYWITVRPARRWEELGTYDALDVEEEHPDETVTRLVEPEEVDDGVHGRSEGTVEPTPTLTDELSRLLWHVCLGLGGFHVGQRPAVVSLRDELETEDTIFGQEHVLREDVHAINTLWSEAVCERVIAMEVLLQRAAEDGAVSVRGECTWQHRHVSEGALERLV